MNVIGVIPARWHSSRFEGKILAEIKGKPMIWHVYERCKACKSLDDLMVATDDARILAAIKDFDAKGVMTSKDHTTGSDRIAEVVESLNVDIVVNIQGDEPLIDPHVVDALVESLKRDETCSMATVIKAIENEEDFKNPNVVKVVIDNQQRAIYFSRASIPYERTQSAEKNYKHLGLYAYRKDFLMTFKDLPKTPLEQSERLEQLRALEAGYKIKTIETNVESIGVDTQEDLERVKKILEASN